MQQQWNRKNRSRVWRIVAIYAVFSLLWIYGSDRLLGLIVQNQELLTRVSIAKGMLFVLLSAALLYRLISDYTRRLGETHQQVRDSEERFQTIFAGLSDAVFICDVESGEILDVNPAACAMFGFDRAEMLQQSAERLCFGSSLSRSEVQSHIALAASDQPQLFEWQARKKNDSRFWVEVNMRRISFRGRHKMLSIVRDINTRKQDEVKLRETKNLFATVFRVSPDSININRLSDGMYLQTNDGFTQFTGYTAEDVAGRTFLELDLWADPHDRETLVKRLGETGVVNNFEARFRKKYGSIAIGLLSASIIEIAGESCMLSIARDISERRQLEQQNLRSAQLASVGQLAAGVAHEINNPINGVINYAQLLLNRTVTSKTSDEILALIIKEGDRIAEIVKELLFFSRDSNDQFCWVTVDDLMKSVLTLTGKYIERHGIRIETELQAGLPPLTIIPQKIEQVLINLMSNARHALDQRFPESHPDKRLLLRAHRVQIGSADFCRLVVRDQGIGMSAALLQKIEQPFFTTKPAGEGTGLGMSICREIMTQHRGTMDIESIEGEYTEIRIDLPINASAEAVEKPLLGAAVEFGFCSS
jgi:PAS domain S-box-containing protein